MEELCHQHSQVLVCNLVVVPPAIFLFGPYGINGVKVLNFRLSQEMDDSLASHHLRAFVVGELAVYEKLIALEVLLQFAIELPVFYLLLELKFLEWPSAVPVVENVRDHVIGNAEIYHHAVERNLRQDVLAKMKNSDLLPDPAVSSGWPRS